ncbi:hypothetical protein KAT95_00170 [Candidatus Parcubacteria bacterium]|nr:hypothetical protein [Candidatus Parcubacteria bacterium]
MNYLKLFYFLLIFSCIFLITNSVSAAAPSAITGLRCIEGKVNNGVWLRWVIPSNSPTSWEVKYSLSNINASNYSQATEFSQNWEAETTQAIVYGLPDDATLFFAMKAINNDGSSGISNIVRCYVVELDENKDEEAPVSLITNLEQDQEILAEQDFTIQGQSTDTGGSSVQKVEISFDNGETWVLANPKTSIETGFTWEYVWEDPAQGDYNIKTRAIDWWNNTEEPKEAIAITVVLEIQEPEPEPEPEPITPMTADELKEKIKEIQQQIIELITQLIQKLQEQIT